MIDEITSVNDIVVLAKSGFSDWKHFGEVAVVNEEDLSLFNYTTKAQFDDRFNFFESVSRGLIINRITGELVARPFDKFFNWGQGGRRACGHIVTITEKIDGSLGILYRRDGCYRIATRGSFHSEQADWATKQLQNYGLSALPNEFTLLFEIVYPENRVVVDYGDVSELFLLAIRNRFDGTYRQFYPDVYDIGEKFGFKLPSVFSFNNVTEIIERTGTLDATQEGFVVEFSDEQRFKFKGDKYLELHRLISGMSFKNTVKAFESGEIDYIHSQIPDEFLGLFDGWVDSIETTLRNIRISVNEVFLESPRGSKKEFALWVQSEHKDLSPYLFAMWDGRDITPLIYKLAFRDA